MSHYTRFRRLAPSRRDVLKGATALAGGLVAAPLLGRRAFGQDRKMLKVMSWEQFQPGEKDGWNALFDKFNQSQSAVRRRMDRLARRPVHLQRGDPGPGRRHRRRRADGDARPRRPGDPQVPARRTPRPDRRGARHHPERRPRVPAPGRQALRPLGDRRELRPRLQQGALRRRRRRARHRPRRLGRHDGQAHQAPRPVRHRPHQQHLRRRRVVVPAAELLPALRRQVGRGQHPAGELARDGAGPRALEAPLRRRRAAADRAERHHEAHRRRPRRPGLGRQSHRGRAPRHQPRDLPRPPLRRPALAVEALARPHPPADRAQSRARTSTARWSSSSSSCSPTPWPR